MPLIEKGDEGKALGDSSMIETDLFEHRDVKPHFINRCCFGEDFAAWLKKELLSSREFGFELSEASQEDYGWGFYASRGHDRFWIALSYVGDGPQESPAQWVISVTYEPGLNLLKRMLHRSDSQALKLLRDRIRQIVVSNSEIRMIKS